MANVAPAEDEYVRPLEVPDVELYHAKSWVTKYVFSQDAKVIAIQYSVTAGAIGLVALVLSWLMRLQLGFPDVFTFIDPTDYYQFITMHGMIMVIYLLTALFLGGLGGVYLWVDPVHELVGVYFSVVLEMVDDINMKTSWDLFANAVTAAIDD